MENTNTQIILHFPQVVYPKFIRALFCSRRYRILVPAETGPQKPNVSSLMTKETFDNVHDLFLEAARLAPDADIDADVQVCFWLT